MGLLAWIVRDLIVSNPVEAVRQGTDPEIAFVVFVQRRDSGFRQTETFAGILKLSVLVYSQTEPGTDPDSAGAVLIDRVNVLSHETITRRKARHHAFGHAG